MGYARSIEVPPVRYSPMPVTDPAYVGAAGALGGVALMIVSQFVTGHSQRQHDRIIKLFDAKVELFSTFATALEVLGRAGANRKTAETMLKDVTIEYESLQENQERVIQYATDVARRAGTGAELGLQAKNALELIANAKTEREELLTRLDKLAAEVRQKHERLLEAQAHFNELVPRVSLIAEEGTQHEIALIMEMIIAGKTVESRDLRGFRRAARRELGVRNRRILEKINDARRWVRMKRIRAKVQIDNNDPEPQAKVHSLAKHDIPLAVDVAKISTTPGGAHSSETEAQTASLVHTQPCLPGTPQVGSQH